MVNWFFSLCVCPDVSIWCVFVLLSIRLDICVVWSCVVLFVVGLGKRFGELSGVADMEVEVVENCIYCIEVKDDNAVGKLTMVLNTLGVDVYVAIDLNVNEFSSNMTWREIYILLTGMSMHRYPLCLVL